MGVLLLIGPHQSGKSRMAWDLLHASPVGTAVLCTPSGTFGHEQLRAWHAAFADGPSPRCLALDRLLLLAARNQLAPGGSAAAAHALRTWAGQHLLGTPLESIAQYRATAQDLAATCARLDDHQVDDQELDRLRQVLSGREPRLAGKLLAIKQARGQLQRLGLTSRSRRLVEAARGTASLPWRLVVLDDLISLTPAELTLLAAIAERLDLVITAVEDDRLRRGSLLERLRQVFPGASEQRLVGLHPRSPHEPAMRQLLQGALAQVPVPPQALSCYHYRDQAHAGRSLAAWLRSRQVGPGEVTVFVRAADGEALALADALIAAGVPVRGRFQLPLASLATGGLLAALGAWCQAGRWQELLEVLARLGQALCGREPGPATQGALPQLEAPTPPAELQGAWSLLPAREALARLQELLEAGQSGDGWRWDEISRQRTLLRATILWITSWLEALSAPGSYLERLRALIHRLGLTDQVPLLEELQELAQHGPVAQAELLELVARSSTSVERGELLPQEDCLLLVDAVRGRAGLRPVSVLHGLEHARWPAAPARGVCLGREERRLVALRLERTDPWDEAGQASGEIAAVLATLARGTRLALLGVPCGTREPSPVLGALLAQAGRDLARERADGAGEVAPGAPLGPDDSQGPGEAALWQPRRQVSFRFRLPCRTPGELRLSASRLNDLLQDPMAMVLDALCLHPPLQDGSFNRDGEQLHLLLARMAAEPPERWRPDAVVREWIELAQADPLQHAARSRLSEVLETALSEERERALGWVVLPEHAVSIRIPVLMPDGPASVLLRGRADRVDTRERQARLVDYKLSPATRRRVLVRRRWEGQLAAYAAGLHEQQFEIAGAYYLCLKDGDAAGYGGPAAPAKLGAGAATVADLDRQLERIGSAIATLAAGEAATDPQDGLCEDRGFASLVRLQEARLSPPPEPDESGEEAS